MSRAAQHTKTYMRRNWIRLTAISVAWAVIILGTGILYGFQGDGSLLGGLEFTAKPLAIGFASGLGFGILTGIMTKLAYKYNDNPEEGKTIAEVLQYDWLGRLGMTTQMLIITISISIALAAIPVIPVPMGVVFGTVVGNYLSTKFAFDADLTEDKAAQLERLRTELETLKLAIEKHRNGDKAQLKIAADKLSKEITKVQAELDKP